MRLRSGSTTANHAEKNAVAPPTQAMVSSTAGASWKSQKFRQSMYTPAATIVAAWISAETGVGPSMASGSHTCSGICADLPSTPQKISRPMKTRVSCESHPDCSRNGRRVWSRW